MTKNISRRGERFGTTGQTIGTIIGKRGRVLWVAYDDCSQSFEEQCAFFDSLE